MSTLLIEWSKTLLYSHSIIPRLLDAIDEELDESVSLGFGARHYKQGLSTYDFLNNMLNAGIRKRRLSEIYNVINDAISELDETSRELLVERFFKKRCIEDILVGISIRTVYRRYDSALKAFGHCLIKRGYTADVLDKYFGEEKVMKGILDRIKNKERLLRAAKVREDKREKVNEVSRVDVDSNRVTDRTRELATEIVSDIRFIKDYAKAHSLERVCMA